MFVPNELAENAVTAYLVFFARRAGKNDYARHMVSYSIVNSTLPDEGIQKDATFEIEIWQSIMINTARIFPKALIWM